MFGFWMLLILFVLLVAAIPVYPYSRGWGYRPGGFLLALFFIWLIVIYFGIVAFWWPWAPPAAL
jgi:hypothetical protein